MTPKSRPPRSTSGPIHVSSRTESEAQRGHSPRSQRRNRPRAHARLADGQERANYLEQVCQVLWPDPTSPAGSVATTDAPSAVRGLLALPSAERPRIVIPGARRAAAAAVRRYGEPSSVRTLVAVRGLSLLLRAGAGSVLGDRLGTDASSGAPTIESYLREQLGPDLHVSMHIGGARANRKPVLQLLTARGATVGFAKIGTSPLTRKLVCAERDALIHLSRMGLTRLKIPEVLHAGTWGDLDVLVLSPLPVWHRRVRLATGQLTSAMRELSEVAGTIEEPLTTSSYWQRLTARLDGADDTADRQVLRGVLSALPARADGKQLAFGSSHGDWTPWNMAGTRGGLLVWDWERFDQGVPIGFDALHYWLQARVASGAHAPAAAADCIRHAPQTLAAFGVDAGQARVTGLAYVADLAVRYLVDRQAETGVRLGAAGQWLIPALRTSMARP
jgi:hypothetical protein